MKRQWMGALVAACFFGSTAAVAEGQMQRTQQQDEEIQQGQGGSGQAQQQQAKEEMSEEKAQQQQMQQGQQQQPQEQQMQQGQQQQQASLEGEFISKEGELLYLKHQEGAIVPVKITQQTQIEFKQQSQQQQSQQQQQHAQKVKKLEKLSPGTKLSATLRQEAGTNVAQKLEVQESAEQQLSGKVVSSQGDWLNVELNGALVPLKADDQTQFQGGEQQQISSVNDLKEGDEIRASFMVEQGTQNVAQSIELQSRGQQQQQQQQPPQQQQQPPPEQQQQPPPEQQY